LFAVHALHSIFSTILLLASLSHYGETLPFVFKERPLIETKIVEKFKKEK